MFASDLKKPSVWLTVTLLLVSVSICSNLGYPQTAYDEDPTVAKESLDDEEDHEVVQDEEDEASEEDYSLEEVLGVENDTKAEAKGCADIYKKCNDIPCCDRWECSKSFINNRCEPKKDKNKYGFLYN